SLLLGPRSFSPGPGLEVRQPPVLVGSVADFHPRVRLLRVGRLRFDGATVAPRGLELRIDDIPARPRADRDRDTRLLTGRDHHVVGVGRAVEVVPRLHEPLLALDEEDALACDDQETLLIRLAVVHARGLARPEDADVEADLVETEIGALAQPGIDAHFVRIAPDRLARIDDVPAVAVRDQPVLGA